MSQPVLIAYALSSCSWRVRIALQLKKITYDIKPVTFKKTGDIVDDTDEFRKTFNPMEQVPVLQIDGHTLIESMAIINYLDETRPEPALLPPDAAQRAKIRAICEIVAIGIQPFQKNTVTLKIAEDKRKEWLHGFITRGFTAIEHLLAVSSGKYCVGDQITMADCLLVPQVYHARRFRVDLSAFPNIVRIDKELEGHPAFQAAHPRNQPDCPDAVKGGIQYLF